MPMVIVNSYQPIQDSIFVLDIAVFLARFPGRREHTSLMDLSASKSGKK